MKVKELLFALSIVFVFVVSVYVYLEKPYVKVEKGDVFSVILTPENSFEKQEKIIYRVLQVKDGWAKVSNIDNGFERVVKISTIRSFYKKEK